MSVTYPDHIVVDRPVAANAVAGPPPVAESAPYTPVYARSGKARNGRKAVKTWMILAPIGAVVLIGGAVTMAIGGDSSEPLGAPVAVESTPLATDAAPLAPATPVPAATVAPVATVAPAAPAPVARQAVVTPSRAPVVRPRVETPAVAAAAAAAAEPAPAPAGPQPYVSATEPAVIAAPSPPTPVLPPETVTSPPID